MTAFVVAMDCEAECVIRHLADATESRHFGRRVVVGKLNGTDDAAVVVSGVGKSNAAAATQLALSLFNPPRIVNLGVAGGLRPSMAVGEIYAVESAVEYDFDLATLNGTAVGTLNERRSPYIPLVVGNGNRLPTAILGSGDRFTDDGADIPILTRLGVALRDMEGAAIAHVCETAGVPCLSWKCVSDVHGGKPMTGQYKENLALCLARLADFAASAPFVDSDMV